MIINRSLKGSKLSPYTLSDEELLGIGRLISACAEIEDIINLYLCDLADLGLGQTIILFGRMSASSKLKIAETLASVDGGDAPAIHKECFDNEHYYDIVRCRNTVAHGILMGKDEGGLIAFQVQETLGVDGTTVSLCVNAYEGSAFQAYANQAEGVIPQLETRLKLQPSRERYRKRGLDPQPKAQQKKTQSVKPKRQRKPSRKKPPRFDHKRRPVWSCLPHLLT